LGREAGKRWERMIAKALRPIFPDVQRNAGEQSRDGGKDLVNTEPFAVEIKGGKSYKWVGVRKILDQCHAQAADHEWELSVVKPAREDPYILMPLDDFLEMLETMKEEGIL
jgi:hypothetical protein